MPRLASADTKSLTALLVFGLLTLPALAQPPRATCDGNENLTGADMTPQNLTLGTPLTNDFSMTGGGCTEAGFDHVTCFVPENDCTLNFDCVYVPAGAATIAVNVFSGSCTTSPTTCIGSSSGLNAAALSSVALTAGTQYCVVCESSANATNLNLDFDSDGGAGCGSLPVTLQEFTISRAEETEDAEAGGVAEESPEIAD